MADKIKAGLLLLKAKWFSDVGIGNDPSGLYRELPGMIDEDAKTILGTLEKHFDVTYPGPVDMVDDAQAAARRFQIENIEVLVIVHLMWSEDAPLIKVLKEIHNKPVLIWCYNPYRKLPDHLSVLELFRCSGTVGMLQGSAPMRRMGVKFSFLYGTPGDKETDDRLTDYVKVLDAAIRLKSLRIGQVASRCEPMTGTYLDEFRLLSRLGPTLVPVSAYRLYEKSVLLNPEKVSGFIRDLKIKYAVEGVSDRSLTYAAKASMAVSEIMEEEHLGAVAVQDLDAELHRLLKTRPCLWIPGLREDKAVVGMEADVISTLGMWIGRQIGGSTPMYTEIFTYDAQENALLMGHAAMHDPLLAGGGKITIVPDDEYALSDEVEGAWTCFSGQSGPVTVISLFADEDNYRMLIFEGESMPVMNKLSGYSSFFVKIGEPLESFFKKALKLGMTQHFSVCCGKWKHLMADFCDIAGIECIQI